MTSASKQAEHKNANNSAAWRLVFVLTFAGIVSGFLIVMIYQLTLPTITTNKANELKEAVFTVLPQATKMLELSYQHSTLVSEARASSSEENQQPIYAGFNDNNELVGYAIPAQGAGFQDTIKILYGYKPESRMIIGMAVLDSRETPGLGDKIYKDKNFVASFSALATNTPIRAVKNSNKAKTSEIDAITGATISSKAVVRIINSSNEIWLPRISQLSAPPVFDKPDNNERHEMGEE